MDARGVVAVVLADPGRRAVLEAVVAKHDLRIGECIGAGFTPKGAVMGFRAKLPVLEPFRPAPQEAQKPPDSRPRRRTSDTPFAPA